MKKTLLSVALAALSAMPIMAQWSDDPTEYTRINPIDKSNYGYTVKTTDDGLSYLYIHVPNAYNPSIRIQIIDKDGNLLLGEDGKEISAEQNITYTKVGDNLMIDKDDNAIIAFTDYRTGEEVYNVYKIDQTGEILWSKTLNDGVSPGMLAGMSMTTTDDGGYMFSYLAYTQDDVSSSVSVYIEKLKSDGTDAWDKPIVLDGITDNTQYNYPYLVDAGANQTILVYAKGANQDLYARLIDFDGSSVWGDEDVLVWQGGFTSNPLHTMMDVYPGPDGGALVAWMNSDANSGNYENRLSYVMNDGTYGFSTGDLGTNVSNATDYSRGYPQVYVDTKEQAIYCLWQQYDQSYQSYHGLYMQKMSYDGELLWGADGKAVIEMQDNDTYSYYTIQGATDGNFAVFYMKLDGVGATGSVSCYMTLYDKDGNMIQEPACFATCEETLTGLESSQLIDGKYYLTNFENYGVDTNVYMQRVFLNGSLTGIKDVNTDNADKKLLHTDVFSLDGQQKEGLSEGVNLVKEVYTDGTTAVKKQIK